MEIMSDSKYMLLAKEEPHEDFDGENKTIRTKQQSK